MNREDKSKKGKNHSRQSDKSKKVSRRQDGPVKKQSPAREVPIVKNTRSNKEKPSTSNEIRLNKYISNSGICSRRDADIYIASGNVTVNGRVVTEMGYKVTLTDEVKFDGRAVNPEKKAYVLLNKPKGFIVSDDLNVKKNVLELVANATKGKISPIVKLDRTCTGLLLFTNDAELIKKISNSNNHNVRKIYHIVLNKNFKHEDLHKVKEGLVIENAEVKIDEISFIDNGNKNEVGIKTYSGKNNIVKKVFQHLDYEIIKMDCVSYAGLTKKDLPRGTWRYLTKQEIINLKML